MNGVERSNDGVVLKKCPFCGWKAYLETIPNLASNEYVVCCSNKECTGFYIGYGDIGLYGTKEGAINAWNTRKPVEEVIGRLEELFKYNSEQVEIYMFGDDSYMREKKEMYMDRANCYGVAIKIIKEELM